MPRLGHILESSLYVDDLDRSEAFYRRVFGLETFLRDERMCAMGVPGAQVLLLFRRGGSTQPSHTPGGDIPPHDATGCQHLCFAIPAEALAAWEMHLAEVNLAEMHLDTRLPGRGIALESRVHWPRGGVSLYFRDPDGHSLEVATPGLWPNY